MMKTQDRKPSLSSPLRELSPSPPSPPPHTNQTRPTPHTNLNSQPNPGSTPKTNKKTNPHADPGRFPPRTDQGERQCTNCSETDTPQWRGTLCNACALWRRSRGTDRPMPLMFPRKRGRSPWPSPSVSPSIASELNGGRGGCGWCRRNPGAEREGCERCGIWRERGRPRMMAVSIPNSFVTLILRPESLTSGIHCLISPGSAIRRDKYAVDVIRPGGIPCANRHSPSGSFALATIYDSGVDAQQPQEPYPLRRPSFPYRPHSSHSGYYASPSPPPPHPQRDYNDRYIPRGAHFPPRIAALLERQKAGRTGGDVEGAHAGMAGKQMKEGRAGDGRRDAARGMYLSPSPALVARRIPQEGLGAGMSRDEWMWRAGDVWDALESAGRALDWAS